jgi:urea transport system substrate-binding protein
MLPELASDAKYQERFLREARTMAAVTHEHIVVVYQVGLAAGSSGREDVPYLAMQMLAGESLEDRLVRQTRLPVEDAMRIGRQIAEGLAAAHEQGLIHRDIKPANIFLQISPADSGVSMIMGPPERTLATPARKPRVKILDFGLARWQEGGAGLSQAGQIIGTPFYMSPEQGAGQKTDHRSDLFSLGCVMYVMLSGQRPFEGSSTMAVLTALAVREPKPIGELVPEVSPALAALVTQLLSKEPSRRPDSAFLVAQQLAALEPNSSSVSNISPPAPSSRPALYGRLAIAGLLTLLLMLTALLGWHFLNQPGESTQASNRDPEPVVPSGEPILVGVLHSVTGTMRESEKPVLEMTRLALEDINKSGGLLGRPIKILDRDGRSDETFFGKEAETLISHDKVVVLFGCWTSASRKAVKDVVERHNHLLIYPVQHEGLEQSANIVYTGAAPNQQLLPAVDWCRKKGFKRYFLVGSDYVFPRSANAILSDKIKKDGGEVVGERYMLLKSTDVADIVKEIDTVKPDVILNTINGATNQVFFPELRRHDLSPQQMPTISFSLDEASIRSLDVKDVAGDYLAWNYFHDLPGETNRNFVKRFQDHYGSHRIVTDPMEGAYLGVRFWAQAVAEAGTTDPVAVRRTIRGQRFAAPEGPNVIVDATTQHTWKYFRLGQIGEDWRIKIVESHDSATAPQPFPSSRKRKEWEEMLEKLFKDWNNHWSNPGM